MNLDSWFLFYNTSVVASPHSIYVCMWCSAIVGRIWSETSTWMTIAVNLKRIWRFSKTPSDTFFCAHNPPCGDGVHSVSISTKKATYNYVTFMNFKGSKKIQLIKTVIVLKPSKKLPKCNHKLNLGRLI